MLGLGNIGALAGKPVMEGKGVLFKKFAGIDVFDIEVDELDPDKFINVVAALEPTFGGINLEDIKAPECFYIEQKLRERMNIRFSMTISTERRSSVLPPFLMVCES
ncbi:NADP-dependent malate dehydrogenase [Salmonella enterica subsp. enterica]|nr:NADP-dependent malate dehydrogenase [Salmonella enterica subsp. enterica]